jgi:hypothetical protein
VVDLLLVAFPIVGEAASAHIERLLVSHIEDRLSMRQDADDVFVCGRVSAHAAVYSILTVLVIRYILRLEVPLW